MKDPHSIPTEETEAVGTQRLSEEGRRLYMERMSHTTRDLSEHDTAPIWIDKGDVLARVNALIKYAKTIRMYIVLGQNLHIPIENIRPNNDGTYWSCPIVDSSVIGASVIVPCGTPIVMYIQ